MSDILKPEDRPYFCTQPIGKYFRRVTFQTQQAEPGPLRFVADGGVNYEMIKWAAAIMMSHCMMIGDGKTASAIHRALGQPWPNEDGTDAS